MTCTAFFLQVKQSTSCCTEQFPSGWPCWNSLLEKCRGLVVWGSASCSKSSLLVWGPAELHSGVWADSQKWLTQNALAGKTLDARHVKMNHAMQHMAPTVLFARLLLLAQSDAHCPWPAVALDGELRYAGPLKLQSRVCQQDWTEALSPWNFTTVTVCAFCGTMQFDGPISLK